MKRLPQRAGTHFKRSTRFIPFETTVRLAGANVDRAARSQIQALGHVTADVTGDCIGVLVPLITALTILMVQLAYDAPVILRQVGAASIEVRISSPVKTPPFMYAGVRG